MRLVGSRWEYDIRLLPCSKKEAVSELLRKIDKRGRWECHEITGVFPDTIAILKRKRKTK